MQEALLYKKLKNEKLQCQNCAHYCLLENNQTGKCKVRINVDGKLFALNYGRIAGLNIDPIEKKPLYHFLPGTKSLSFGLFGCPFSCQNCQNWTISQSAGNKKEDKLDPSEIIRIAKRENIPSISYTYTEPTIFLEYALEVMKLAKKENLKNVWVSNGFFSKEALEIALPHIDAINIDLKSFSDDFYQKICKGRLKPVLESIKKISKTNTHLEITTLLIPEYVKEKDLKEIADFINSLDQNIPWHISKFYSDYSWKMKKGKDTTDNDIEKAEKIGREAGLKYIYGQNNNTICPDCNQTVIKRSGYKIKRLDKNGRCPSCDKKII